VALKILYHEDALADLEALLDWSRDNFPETTEKFAADLFNHLDLLAAFPYIGFSIQGQAQAQVPFPFAARCLLPSTRGRDRDSAFLA